MAFLAMSACTGVRIDDWQEGYGPELMIGEHRATVNAYSGSDDERNRAAMRVIRKAKTVCGLASVPTAKEIELSGGRPIGHTYIPIATYGFGFKCPVVGKDTQ